MFKKTVAGFVTAALIGTGMIYGFSFTQQGDEKATGPKEHSKLYKQYNRRERKLTELAATATSDFAVVEGVPQRAFRPDSPRLDSRSLIQQLTCKADAVVSGVVKSKTSQLTEDENFIFSDYDVLVEGVLKNNPAAPIQPNTRLSVTRPGGTVRLNGLNVSARDEVYRRLDVGSRYLLFLQYVPVAGTYSASDSGGGFELKGNKISKLTEESLPLGLETDDDAGALLANVSQAASGGCDK